jgi:lipopolysaccharide/colanic/teichoic acid biosynthesis glycosyltransferase
MTAHYPELLEAPHSLATPVPSGITLRTRPGPYRNGIKRGLDILLILLSLPVVLPVVGLLALMVMRDGHAPFYTQARVGVGGHIFRFWKLRSMVCDADERLSEYLDADPGARAEWDHSQKLKADPRITRFGNFLRKSSLDELPQLWNVLKGDMSLVGPRPMMDGQQVLYPGSAYYALRPGITGPWQVSDRNASSFAARADFDSAYEETLSFAGDLRILAATFGAVVRGTGY